MLLINGRKYATSDSEMVDSLFNGGEGTLEKFHKIKHNKNKDSFLYRTGKTRESLPERQRYQRNVSCQDGLDQGQSYEAEANGNSPCILALRNPWTEEPGGLQFMG